MQDRKAVLVLVEVEGQAVADVHRRERADTGFRPGHAEQLREESRGRDAVLRRHDQVIELDHGCLLSLKLESQAPATSTTTARRSTQNTCCSALLRSPSGKARNRKASMLVSPAISAIRRQAGRNAAVISNTPSRPKNTARW